MGLTDIARSESVVRALDNLTSQTTSGVLAAVPQQPAVEDPLYSVDDGLVDTFLTREEWIAILNAWSRKQNGRGDILETECGLAFVNVTPLSLIRRAFGMQDFQITGYPLGFVPSALMSSPSWTEPPN